MSTIVLIGAAAVVIVGATYIVMKKLIDAAMDRELPKNMRNKCEDLPVDEHLAEIFRRRNRCAEKLLAADTETVKIASYDGLTLTGHIYKGKSPKRVIIAVHGWRSSWAKDFGLVSDFWHKNDCMVLYVEQRARGGSEGEYICFGLKERYDCLSWIDYINQHTEGRLPIYLCGVSMGATSVLMAAGSELPETVRGIIADCAFTSPHHIWKHIARDRLHLPYGKLAGTFANIFSKQKIGIASDAYTTTEAMRSCKVPVFFVHGSDDGFVPIEMTYQNYKACRAPKQLLVVPGANHGMSYVENQPGYEQMFQAMWSEYDSLPSRGEGQIYFKKAIPA